MPNFSAITLITPEYAPQPGGLADHTALLAHALAQAGIEVTVVAPGELGRPVPTSYRLIELPGHYGPRALLKLDRLLAAANRSKMPVLLQYVPHGYGLKGMNLPLVSLVSGRTNRLWTLFHELYFPMSIATSAPQRVMALAQYAMAWQLARCSERLLVATSAWTPLLEALNTQSPVEDLPIFSNIPPLPADQVAEHLLYPLLPGEQRIAHFGTYGAGICAMLLASLPTLLSGRPQRRVLLMGRGAGRFAARLIASHDVAPEQINVLDDATPAQIAAGLSSARVVLQPYPDGVTTRRGSLLAALAQGAATVATEGELTEPFWHGCDALVLVPASDPAGLVPAVEALLDNVAAAQSLGSKAATLYSERFSPEKNVAILRVGAQCREA